MRRPSKKKLKRPCGRGISVARLKDGVIHRLEKKNKCGDWGGKQIDLELVKYVLKWGEACICARCWPKYGTFLEEVF